MCAAKETKNSQALDNLHRLGEVALVGDLDDVSPDALVVLGKDRCHILHSGGAGGHRGLQRVQLGPWSASIGVSSSLTDLVLVRLLPRNRLVFKYRF